ncbi:MAG: DUF4249 family protein [Balneolaceae bacterium]|nr:MAG: DUF4249 family protein [Balneolaceae bacterium]
MNKNTGLFNLRQLFNIGTFFTFHFCLFTLFTACDDSFQPFQENDTYFFSIHGYLDASADTQWVRVGTIRQNIDELPDPEGIRVTLKDLQSGETVVMNDSVFTSQNVLNFWTTMDIKHEQTYEITAEHTDGNKSRVTVTTPTGLPSINIVPQCGVGVSPGARIFIDDTVEHIADLQSVWYVILNPGTENRRRIYTFPLRNILTHTSGYRGSYTARVYWDRELTQIEQSVGLGTEISVTARQFFVAAAGPEWDDNISSIVNLEYFLLGTASNVENGLGYVVGVCSKWFRQDSCLTPDRSNTAPCVPEEPFWYHD